MSEHFEVLIVGAGPTGLMMANQLARRNVRSLIIDRHAGPSRETRALGVQSRTMEIYARLGIAGRALELGKIATGANLWADGRKTARVPVGEAGSSVTPYPYVLILGQDDNERIMGERLRTLGQDVQWNTELTALAQDADGASATLKQPDGALKRITAGWVAGCDGAHSAVRKACGIPFEGAAYEHVFFVADTEVTGNMVPDELNVYLWKKGFHLFFPMRGKDHWRLVGIFPPGVDPEGAAFESVLPSLRNEAGAGLEFKSCSWFSTYRIHHRAAAKFRDRRCFLLGDAAHIHSPVGAQGMNTGLQDAYNLAWKLALVCEGRADPVLLDSFEAERLPVARRLLDTTDRAFRLIVSDSWVAGLMRTKVLARVAAFAMSQRRIQAAAFGVISQTGIHYRESFLSQSVGETHGRVPRAGDRFPWLKVALHAGGAPEDLFGKLDDTRFTLLVIGQPVPPEMVPVLGRMADLIAIPAGGGNAKALATAGIEPGSYYLLRPDGHIGLCGDRFELAAMERYLSSRIGLRSAASG
jgi:2-polyprenyl-6-methoxyphenol hydroxylase-like FAD-dependent oxidoreductase